jgi:hypothetical protein
MAQSLTLEGQMKKDQEYTDPEGKIWITAAKVADIWNERAINEYKREGNYTRWSVYQRREKLTRMQTPLGDLYLESEAKITPLRPHTNKRPEVASRNRNRRKPKTED